MSVTRQVLKAVFLLAIISTIHSPSNSSKEPWNHTSNSSFPTSRSKPPENTASGDLSDPSQFRDSDNSSTETPHFLPDTKPITTRKLSGTTPQTPVQFLTEASSNKTDMEEENGAGSEEVDTWIIAVAVVASVVSLTFLIIVATLVRRHYKRPRDEQVGTSEHVESHTVDDRASDQGIP